jgi:hypothetical protein
MLLQTRPAGRTRLANLRSGMAAAFFRKEADYAGFEQLLGEAHRQHTTRILAWCLTANQSHSVLRPSGKGAKPCAIHYHHAWSLPVQDDAHCLTARPYVVAYRCQELTTEN